MDQSTGVGVLDKIDLILGALEAQPLGLAELATATGLPRPTAHRLATALLTRRYLDRDPTGRFTLGPRLAELAGRLGDDWLVTIASPVLTELRDRTSESAQLYRRLGRSRLCVASVEPPAGLRDSVPAGTFLPMTAGSAAQVLCAWDATETAAELLRSARFNAGDLARVRKRGWAHSNSEREPGLASLSAPVRGSSGEVMAAVSVSGPVDRIGRSARSEHIDAVLKAAAELENAVSGR